MKILSRYVVFNSLRVMIIALMAFTAIFFIASSVSATREGVTLPQFMRITPFIALYVVRFTLPISLLIGVTLTLGRMVADREVLALRSCGVHYGAIAVPLLAVGLIFSVGLYFYNDRVLPVCDYARRDVLKSFARELLTLQRGRNKSFSLPGYNVFCREYDGRILRGLVIFRDDPELPFEIVAREGHVWLDEDNLRIVISLKDVRITHYGQRDKTSYGELVSENYSIAVPMRQRTKDRPEFLTVAQLAEQIRDLRERIRAFSASYEQANTQEEEAYAARVLTKLVYMRRKAEIELHRRGADALAPFLFLLVGIPFPLLLKSRVKLVPAFAALMTLMATSFAVGLAAESLAESGSLDPWYAMWLGDILTACVGVFLFWKLLEK